MRDQTFHACKRLRSVTVLAYFNAIYIADGTLTFLFVVNFICVMKKKNLSIYPVWNRRANRVLHTIVYGTPYFRWPGLKPNLQDGFVRVYTSKVLVAVNHDRRMVKTSCFVFQSAITTYIISSGRLPFFVVCNSVYAAVSLLPVQFEYPLFFIFISNTIQGSVKHIEITYKCNLKWHSCFCCP
jgi:uncharacterized integral membrane protein